MVNVLGVFPGRCRHWEFASATQVAIPRRVRVRRSLLPLAVCAKAGVAYFFGQRKPFASANEEKWEADVKNFIFLRNAS